MYDFEGEYQKSLLILKEEIKGYEEKILALERKIKEAPREKQVYLEEDLFKIKYIKLKALKMLEFLRQGTSEDYDYRVSIYEEFTPRLKEAIPNSSYRFHGTSIYFARDIITSGEISCSEDRLGFKTSHDLPGHFSASDINHLGITIHNYLDLNNFCMPAGCLFVIAPPDQNINNSQVKKINFKDNPETLVSILTTPENVFRVKIWSANNGIDTKKVMDFEAFLEEVKIKGLS